MPLCSPKLDPVKDPDDLGFQVLLFTLEASVLKDESEAATIRPNQQIPDCPWHSSSVLWVTTECLAPGCCAVIVINLHGMSSCK